MGAILVIADDLTGAAELGGIAIGFGLKTKISHHLRGLELEGVQIINTNTRSLAPGDILTYLKSLFSEKIDVQSWDLIYLKFDSAMRGAIGIQLEFFKNLFACEQLIFCPVNPSLGRIIRDGKYFIQGTPVASSDFARDPEFPVQYSSVKQLLSVQGVSLVEDVEQIHVDMTYIVPAIDNHDQIDLWANQLNNFKMFAGSGAYFERLLVRNLGFSVPLSSPEINLGRPILYVCGSSHEDSIRRLRHVPNKQLSCWSKPAAEQNIANELTEIINRSGVAVFSVQPQEHYPAEKIRNSMGLTVKLLHEQCAIQELIIEGGATAHAVLEHLNIDVLRPVAQLSQGVIRNQVDGQAQMVTMKPGSYPWSGKLWVF